MKTRPVAAQLFRADGQTDMTKGIVVFRYFPNAPNELMSVMCNAEDCSIIMSVQLNIITALSAIMSWQIPTHPA